MSLSRKEKIVLFAVILFACAVVVGSRVYDKKRSETKAKNRIFENPFSGVNSEIDVQSGNYANDALVVDGYVYFYKSRVKLGNYDKVDELEKCGNNVIYRLSPDGEYEEFYTFDDGDAMYYGIGSELYYYDGYFYIQIENRIYRINKEGTEAQVIYENTIIFDGYLTFGIRDHYLVIQRQTEYYYLDLDKWDWSQSIEVGRMMHLVNMGCSYEDVRRKEIYFYEDIIYGTGTYEPTGVYFESKLYGNDFLYLHNLSVRDKENTGKTIGIAGNVYCMNVYKGVIFYAQKVDDSICIKYYSLDDKEEGELITIDAGADKAVKSLVVSDDYIIYDLGSKKEYYGGVDTRVIWNRNTKEIQQTISYR